MAVAAKDLAASGDLQNQALRLFLASPPGEEGSPGGVFEYLPDALVCLCGALEVLLGTNLLTDILGLWMLLVSSSNSLSHIILTCSGVTGFWEVLCSSSIVFWS